MLDFKCASQEQLKKLLNIVDEKKFLCNLKDRLGKSPVITNNQFGLIQEIANDSLIAPLSLNCKFSPNFSWGEMTKTTHRKYLEENRKEALRYKQNIENLCIKILEPVRKLVGLPVYVTSGFRCTNLNDAIGGSGKSQHIKGEAGDIEFKGAREGDALKEIFNTIAFSDIPFSTIILEFGQWVHIGLRDPKLYPDKIGQKMIATRTNNKTKYTLITEPVV